MAKLSRTFSCMAFSGLILFALSLGGCRNTKQYAERIDKLEKEKTTLESQLRELERSNQQTIAAKDGEIARLTELNNTLETKVKELQKQSSESNKKLSQDKAEKAIKALASTFSFDLRGGGNGCSFRVPSIAHIELSQFTDSEATADVLLKCARAAGTGSKTGVLTAPVNVEAYTRQDSLRGRSTVSAVNRLYWQSL